MNQEQRDYLIQEAARVYQGEEGFLCVRAAREGYYRAQDHTGYKSSLERGEVRFMFAYLMLLVLGEEE